MAPVGQPCTTSGRQAVKFRSSVISSSFFLSLPFWSLSEVTRIAVVALFIVRAPAACLPGSGLRIQFAVLVSSSFPARVWCNPVAARRVSWSWLPNVDFWPAACRSLTGGCSPACQVNRSVRAAVVPGWRPMCCIARVCVSLVPLCVPSY